MNNLTPILPHEKKKHCSCGEKNGGWKINYAG